MRLPTCVQTSPLSLFVYMHIYDVYVQHKVDKDLLGFIRFSLSSWMSLIFMAF